MKGFVMLGQFVVIIIAIVLSILFPQRRRYGLFGYRRNYWGYDNDYDTGLLEESSVFFEHHVKASSRRSGALKRCKKFLTRTSKNVYTLKNQNVTFIFDSKKKTMFCLNAKNIKQSAYVEWHKQIQSLAEEGNFDNTFDKVFDSICISFDESSNYGGILQVLKANFNPVKEILESDNKPKIQNAEAIEIPNDKKSSNTKKININHISEEELANLPGINIVIAKKIIRRINLKGDYSSLEDVYKEMKIKKHFQQKLNDLLCAEPAQHEENKTLNDDRIIDL